MLSRPFVGALLAVLLATPGFAAPLPTQLYRIKNMDYPERGHFVPTLTSSKDAPNFETCSGEFLTETEATVDIDDGDCSSDPFNPSLPLAYIGKPVFLGGVKVGIVNSFAVGKDGKWEGLIINPTAPLANGGVDKTSIFARAQDWTLGGPVEGDYSVMLDKPLTDLQVLSMGSFKE